MRKTGLQKISSFAIDVPDLGSPLFWLPRWLYSEILAILNKTVESVQSLSFTEVFWFDLSQTASFCRYCLWMLFDDEFLERFMKFRWLEAPILRTCLIHLRENVVKIANHV